MSRALDHLVTRTQIDSDLHRQLAVAERVLGREQNHARHRRRFPRAPLHQVGALLEAKAVHNGRSARNHLLVLAATCGISDRRVDELLELVGLTDVATKRVGGFSLGMGQRLGIAAALPR